MTIVVSAFYKFATIADPPALRAELLAVLTAGAMKGTILVAPEGINGTVSGTPDAISALHAVLRNDPRFCDMPTKNASTDRHPFERMKVKLKREIITLRRPEADPLQRTGIRIAPQDWNALLGAGDVLLIDTRNSYEVATGTFEGAVDPSMAHFTDWPDYVARSLDPVRHRKIAMFCTGGIRCEKASAYLLARGFETVYQLDGGILAYLAAVPAAQSRWRGSCFVFDERGAVT
jgi:UPF0176 protein